MTMTARTEGFISRSAWGAASPKKTTPLQGRRMLGVVVHHGAGHTPALRRNMRELDDGVDVVVDALHPFVDWDRLPPVPTISQAALDIVQRRRQERAQERRP